MEFWGVEVPSGKPLTCKPGADSYVHVSQAALGDNKSAKGNDRVVLKVKVGSTEVVVGTLSQGKCDQTTLDLIFEKDFVLSHNSSGSVYFCGYKTDAVRDDVSGSSDEDDEFDASEDDLEEDAPELLQLAAKENGRLGQKSGKVEALLSKPAAKAPQVTKVEVSAVEVKPKFKPGNVAEVAKVATEKSEDEDEEDDDEDDEDDDEDDDMLGSGSDEEDVDSDEDDSDDEDESEEEQPKSAGKKRSLPTSLPMVKPGLSAKKSKVSTPGKPEPKIPSAPASTPKQQQQSANKKDATVKKTPGKENATTPASGKKLGQHFCEPCKKNFNSDSALSQHKLAKHK